MWVKLRALQLEDCDACSQRWIDLGVNDTGSCKRCRTPNNKHARLFALQNYNAGPSHRRAGAALTLAQVDRRRSWPTRPAWARWRTCSTSRR
jgi:hypothetical protein